MDDAQTKFVLRLEFASKTWERAIDFALPVGSLVIPFALSDESEALPGKFIASQCTFFAFENVCEIAVSQQTQSDDQHIAQICFDALLQAGWYEISQED